TRACTNAEGYALRSRRARAPLAERGLRRGEPRDRHPERRARHVIEPDLVAEGDRSGVAAVLAADADLELRPRRAPTLDPDPDELGDALAVDGDERIGCKNSARHIGAEKARRVVATDAEGGLGQIIGAEREELRACGDLAGAQRRARQLDHGADLIVEPRSRLARDRLGHGVDARLDQIEL